MLEQKIDLWKKSLLDLGKRNRLINFRQTKRSNINIIEPGIEELYSDLVLKEKALRFPVPINEQYIDGEEVFESVSEGDVLTNRTIQEQQKTLRSLRNKARTSLQEQGNNILFISFGFLEWKEDYKSTVFIKSPLILVPVEITIDSVSDPFVIKLYEDEILLNPTLVYKLEAEFGVKFPEFNIDSDDIVSYLDSIEDIVIKNSWKVLREASMSLLSFLKMNMYSDLEKNAEKILGNEVLNALGGESTSIDVVPEEYNNFDHDNEIKPIDALQVVDADSSQLDAILYSKKNISFILQGPPGTGKSQTITNIISEGLADGKKILFVSEKSAALEVVYKRLTNVGLSDFCLPLHNSKKKKIEVLEDLNNTIRQKKVNIRDESLYRLHELLTERTKLNTYIKDLHTQNLPMGKSIYEMNASLAGLPNTKDVIFEISNVEEVTKEELFKRKNLLEQFSKTLGLMKKDYLENPWIGCNIQNVTHEFRLDATIKIEHILNTYKKIIERLEVMNEIINLEAMDINTINILVNVLKCVIENRDNIPYQWFEHRGFDYDDLVNTSEMYRKKFSEASILKNVIEEKYNDDFGINNSIECIESIYKSIEIIKGRMKASRTERFNELIAEPNATLLKIGEFINTLKQAIVEIETTASKYGFNNIKTVADINDFSVFLSAIIELPNLTEAWFNNDGIKRVDELLNRAMTIVEESNSKKEIILELYRTEIFDLNYIEIEERFNTLYSKSFLDTYKKYEKDKTNIGMYLKDGLIEGLSYKKIAELLYGIEEIQEIIEWKRAESNIINEIEDKKERLSKLKEEVVEEYDADILGLDRADIVELLTRFRTEYAGIFRGINKNYKTDKNQIIGFYKNRTKKLKYAVILNTLEQLKEITDIIKWEEDNADFISVYTDKQNRYNELYNQIINETKSEIIELDISSLLVRFKKLYANDFVQIKAQYEDDVDKFVTKLKHNENIISTDNIMDAIKILVSIDSNNKWFLNNEDILKDTFGSSYKGNSTNWSGLTKTVNTFKELWFSNERQLTTANLKEVLINDTASESFNNINNLLKKLCEQDGMIEDISNNILNIECVESKSLIQILAHAEDVKINLELLNRCYSDNLAYRGENCEFKEIVSDLNDLLRLKKIILEVEENKQKLSSRFGVLFDGMETDWNHARTVIDLMNKVSVDIEKLELIKGQLIPVLKDQEVQQAIEKFITDMEKFFSEIESDWNWLLSIFDREEAIEFIELKSLIKRLEECVNGLAFLEEWIDYRRHRKECYDSGLGEYIEKAEEEGVIKTDLVNVYFKRFYKVWLDHYIPKYDSILDFRRKNHEERIDNFKKLDVISMEIAKARIREQLINALPNFDTLSSAKDEMSILNRELNKKRRIMPLRKLFSQIPNLLMAIKPCLMMSPLSVSLFLEAKSYEFDMVIFDEASQVKTEDAVGAIMRGKQVIICGDDKQLPPTSFFGTSLTDDEYDGDDNYDDLDVYESILDESLTVLPQRTLKWHYRSKHEHLIAFSNSKIYNNDLITFPSNVDKVANNGVEYIHVQDGLYDRGGSRSNVIEAKKVAELVFEHFKKFPNRSLGVVAFSGAQQQAIETAIRHARRQDSSVERYFNEDCDESFFVKNIETVQGDERDTIIFSIGYAKDGSGKPMAMNFGPLTKSGGERRLNVAITRAKYNVKLVGSIYPTDIDLNRINSEGVKLLRAYIEFAINGTSALKNEITYSGFVELDSPFEEAIYNYLCEHGYNVATQVGCSGYRIDLAIKHPSLSGVYVLGIECDGATYHSARTARERDRIRQTVLEDIGWKIYRIWSTDWIKDPVTEGQKLIKKIESCIEEYSVDTLTKKKENQVVYDDFLIESRVEDTTSENIYGFKEYVEADIYSVRNVGSDVERLANIVKHVVKVESPIHFELLSRRIAPIFGREKATSVVKDSIVYVMPHYENDVVVKENYYWDRHVDEINVRIPASEYEIRQIDYIANEEIEVALLAVIENSFGITKSSLFGETRKQFGFNRSGNKISTALETAYQSLLDAGRISEVDGKVVRV